MILLAHQGLASTSIVSAIAGMTKYAWTFNATVDSKNACKRLQSSCAFRWSSPALTIHRLDKTKQDFLLPYWRAVWSSRSALQPKTLFSWRLPFRVQIFELEPWPMNRSVRGDPVGTERPWAGFDSLLPRWGSLDFITSTNGDLRSAFIISIWLFSLPRKGGWRSPHQFDIMETAQRSYITMDRRWR